MLARLDQIDGVQSSFLNESGDLMWLSLRPGANPRTIAGSVRRILSEEVEDRVPVWFSGRAVDAALQREQWQDKNQVADSPASAATVSVTSVPRTSGAPWSLLLGGAALLLGLLGWYRSRRAEKAKAVGRIGSLPRTATANRTREVRYLSPSGLA